MPQPVSVITTGALVTLAALALGGCSHLATSAVGESGSPAAAAAAPAAATSQAAEPDTEAGLADAATRFYAFYSARQWAQAWQLLTPADRQAIPQAVFTAEHQGCPQVSDGMARQIKSVVVSGTAGVVTETVAGAASALGTAADNWSYSGGQWGFSLDPSGLAVYSHGSVAADIAAAKAAGYCDDGAQPLPSLSTFPTEAMPTS